jgi:hypothetical protein
MSVVVFGDDHHAARFLVEAVDDAGPKLAPDTAQVAYVKQESIDQRLVAMAGCGVNDEAGRLVDYDDVLILVKHKNRKVLRLDPGRKWRRKIDFYGLSGRDALRRFAHNRRIKSDLTFFDETGQRAAAVIRKQLREHAIQSEPRLLRANDIGAEIAHGVKYTDAGRRQDVSRADFCLQKFVVGEVGFRFRMRKQFDVRAVF